MVSFALTPTPLFRKMFALQSHFEHTAARTTTSNPPPAVMHLQFSNAIELLLQNHPLVCYFATHSCVLSSAVCSLTVVLTQWIIDNKWQQSKDRCAHLGRSRTVLQGASKPTSS